MLSHPKAYEGNEPYVFISYAHKDSDRVLPIIAALQQRGFRVWYDEGLEVGSSWGDMIEEYLYNCECAVCFISSNFLNSQNCKDEIDYAKETEKGPLIVYLDQMEPDRKFRFRYGRLHALKLTDFSGIGAFLDKLCHSELLLPCHTAAAQATPEPTATEPQAEEAFQSGRSCYAKEQYADAIAWFQKAAMLGHADAQYHLAECISEGLCADKTTEDAVYWYEKAAEQRHVEAQYTLAYMHYLADNMSEAIHWYQEAAEQGHLNATKWLADIYSRGIGVKKDPDTARYWRVRQWELETKRTGG